MLYVQQSLGPDEDILMAARFHWMYNVRAAFWIAFGILLGCLVAFGAIWWSLSGHLQNPAEAGFSLHLLDEQWRAAVAERGGYLRILWSLPTFLRFFIFGLFLTGLFLFGHLMIVKATTEIAVTDERVIYKRGLISRDVGELGIDRIEGVAVSQTVLGRILNYGTVIIRGMGIGEVDLPPLIEDPIGFRKAIQEARNIREREKVTGIQEHPNRPLR